MNEIWYIFSQIPRISFTNISIISVMILFLVFLWGVKEPKSTYRFWSKQPIQQSPGKFPNKITTEKPRIYKQDGFVVKELRSWNPEFISDFSPDIYKTMCRDKDAIVLCLIDERKNNIPVGFIYGQKQFAEGGSGGRDETHETPPSSPPPPEGGKEVIYVGGLYLLPEYRGRGLAAVLISNIVGKWWKICDQFIFLHDKKILEDTIKPIQSKKIYIYCPWVFWTYGTGPRERRSRRHKRYISFQSPKNNRFLEKDFGVIYHVHGYSLYIHSMKNSKRFDKEMLMKLSTKHPWVLFVYVPEEYTAITSGASYERYIYGYNLRGGSKKQGIHFRIADI
jgi:GNAT superfamily N-acetyltransferase